MRRLAITLGIAAGVVAASLGFAVLGLPSPTLFAGVVVGLLAAIARPSDPRPPTDVEDPEQPQALRRVNQAGNAVIGVSLGLVLTQETLREIAAEWLPLLLVTVATILVSLLAGRLLARSPSVDLATGTFALIAGGAAGLTSMSRELGADERVVSVVQYLRVLVVLVTLPVVVLAIFDEPAVRTAGTSWESLLAAGPRGWPAELGLLVGVGVAGTVLARLIRVPSAALLGPMLVAAIGSSTGLIDGFTVPMALLDVAFAVLGVSIGLAFTRAAVVAVARILPAAMVLVVAVIGACAAFGAVLVQVSGVSALTAYLATTPGGFTAVLATASGSGADASYVLAVQTLRLFVVLFGAPLLGRWFRRGGAASTPLP